MLNKRSVDLPVRWEFSSHQDGKVTLAFEGELDLASTPVAWPLIEKELARTSVSLLQVDVRQLASCDSAGLALLYHISVGAMTPGAAVNIAGLGP
jgi:anti-anti-sigma factor